MKSALFYSIITAMVLTLLSGTRVFADASLATRCGWFSNPTPGNMWLQDKDGEWTIAIQMGHQAEGDWDWPKYKANQWISTNRSYGYGCTCFKMRVDMTSHKVISIKKAWAKNLNACRSDPHLQEPQP